MDCRLKKPQKRMKFTFYLSLTTLTAFGSRLCSILIGSLGSTGYPFAVAFVVALVALVYMIYMGKIGRSEHLGLASLMIVLGCVLGLVVVI